MARYTEAVCKLCRREKTKLFLKGSKCTTERCPLGKKNYAPGAHGQSRRQKISEYGIQLREKQKIKRVYGMLEIQFRNLFEKASRLKGRTAENLVKLLECRLDNVVYRLGLAPSRKSARQLIRHRHITVDNIIVDIPSMLLKPGSEIRIREKSRKMDAIHNSLRRVPENTPYTWLALDKAQLKGTFLQVPERVDVPLDANEQLVVELYSK